MSSIKVSALTAKTSPSGSEELLINDSGVSKKITIGNAFTDTNTTYTSSDFTHDSLSGVTANEHIDWTGASAGTIHSSNYTDTNTTYSVQDGELSENNFTDADHTKLNGIEASADVTDATNVTAAGALMDSEVTNLADVKAFDTTDYATAGHNHDSAYSATTHNHDSAYSATTHNHDSAYSATTHNHSGTYEPADATILKDADISSTVQAYDADTAKTDTDQSWTGSQRGTTVTDNDGSFDMDGGNNFKCTPSGNFTLTFTNITDGQSGFILLVNSGGHTVSAASTSKVDANLLATVSTAGTYLISYFSDGTNAYLTNSAIYA